ncbi:MAG TPA: Rieske 2Fe-2S domain-containing protein [Nitrososphaeraceae archaeon]|nr:Rieske 2Fe-2S domain-containing protein [Nitrososphaeraceae archaeon]
MSEEQFQKVANKDDLKEGGMLKAETNGKQIVLSMVEGKVYAIDEICTHEGGPLDEGELNGYDLKCPWHMQYSMLEMEKFQMQQYGQQTLIPIL